MNPFEWITFAQTKSTTLNTVYIAIAGNIGSGKTTLTTLLSKHYKWKPHFEAVDNNPYLNDYYKDVPRWSFNLEVFFLKERFRNLLEISQSQVPIIQDRSIFEGVYVFTANNKDMGYLSDRDYETYMELFNCMVSVVNYPRLLIYLRSSVPHLVENIQKRGREYEQAIPLQYLENLNNRYENFIFNSYQGETLVIDVDNLDFLLHPEDFRSIVDKIDAKLYGLF